MRSLRTLAFAAAICTLGACAASPTLPTTARPGVINRDNGGLIGTGNNTPTPDAPGTIGSGNNVVATCSGENGGLMGSGNNIGTTCDNGGLLGSGNIDSANTTTIVTTCTDENGPLMGSGNNTGTPCDNGPLMGSGNNIAIPDGPAMTTTDRATMGSGNLQEGPATMGSGN
jgi:hypothetical protein